jgi:rfaE bifunctional protein nucleotidyltransferase chain/domain
MRIVTCNGCFDGLHKGHLFFLGFCRAQGDLLIVGINSDNYMRKKKKKEPMFNQNERKRMLEETGIPSKVIIFEENDPIEFIKAIKPQVHCTGIEYIEKCSESKICQNLGISLVFVPRVGNWSSTEMREKCLLI